MRTTTLAQRWFLMAAALGVCSVVLIALLFASGLLSKPFTPVSYLILALAVVAVGAAAYMLASIALQPIGGTISAIRDIDPDQPRLPTNTAAGQELNERVSACSQVVDSLLSARTGMRDEVSQRRTAQLTATASTASTSAMNRPRRQPHLLRFLMVLRSDPDGVDPPSAAGATTPPVPG